jgi:predicted MFS family arabinose efflux permease
MRGRRSIAWYFGALLLFNGLGDPTGLLTLPLLFHLKDNLGLGAQAVAFFEALILIPYYCAFLFGLWRDAWQPRGGDRGYLMLAAPVAVGCYLWLMAGEMSYGLLLAGILGAMVAYQVLDVSTDALVTCVAKRDGMTGRLSALSETMDTLVTIAAMLLGGWMAAHCSLRTSFAVAAVFSGFIFLQAFLRPEAVFRDMAPVRAAETAPNRRTLSRFLANKALWPAAAILLLYNFSPGWGTPFFYYLTEDAGLFSEAFGVVRAMHYGAMIVSAAVYGVLCTRVPLRRLLWWAVAINVFPGFLFLLINGPVMATVVSAVVGVVAGFANVALFDLLRRSCAWGLEGSGTALGASAFGIAGVAGDVLGAWLYEQGGFVVCLVLDALATVAIFPILRLVSPAIVAATDGEHAVPATAS